MEDGLLSLKWNNHKATFLETFRHFREKGLYTDATLAVEGKCYPVHKVVLSTCSDYFNDIFERTSCKCPVIVLKDVRSQDLDSLLDYMYFGEVNVRQNELPILINTAESLKIKGLAMSDEDSSRHSRNSNSHNEDFREVPPSKRKREDTVQLPALSPHKTASTTTAQSEQTRNSSSPSSPQVENNTLVKVEMNENDETEDDRFQSSITEENSDNRDHLLEKSDSEPSSFSASNFSIPPTHQAGEISWDEGDASFPSDGFSVDQSNQQTGGEDDEDVDVTSVTFEGAPSPSIINPHTFSLTQTKDSTRCNLCQVTLANNNLLRRHVEDHHFHIRKYVCEHCGKKFKRKEHRERHIRIHTGEKPFTCTICSAKFTQKEHLKGHVENVHNKHRDRAQHSALPEPRTIETDIETSSPPSLASPSSIASLMASPLAAILPATSAFSHLSHIPTVPTRSPPTSLLTTRSPPNSLLSTRSPPAPLVSFPMTSSFALQNSDNKTTISTSVGEETSLTAFYAPVTRRTASSPNKHLQTITINFD